ncbi:LysR family transcriptional regulator [Bradyrhizobium sp. LTSP885]|uniref:LysR family transcriptional regulator n=1 Tax=Bradyrhizobium sp. LTSP885 TaxID=1619232 RepID=UPI0007C76E26|nr:LysR family transcriptional regulator [Bradyrhizobium sp. LTSP885]
MNIRDLEYFVAIAEEGHLGRAAMRVGRSQPTLTKCIRRLEEGISTKLFVRSGRGIKLTNVGEILLDRSKDLRTAFADTLREIHDVSRGLAGHVRIGTGATTAEYFLPEVCRTLLSKSPGVKVELSIGMNDVLRTALRANRIDLVVGPITEVDELEFTCHDLGRDEVVVAASREHPLVVRRTRPKVVDMVGFGWVLPAPSVATRQWLDQRFAAAGLHPPQVQIETNNISLMPRLIATTNFLSFISSRNLEEGTNAEFLRDLKVDELKMRRRIGVVHQKGRYLSPATHQVLEIMKTLKEMVGAGASAVKTRSRKGPSKTDRRKRSN